MTLGSHQAVSVFLRNPRHDPHQNQLEVLIGLVRYPRLVVYCQLNKISPRANQ